MTAAAGILAAWFAVPPAPLAPEAPPELVRYGFDDEVATGPDTLRVFQNARGSVRLSSAFRLGGYRLLRPNRVHKHVRCHDRGFGRFPRRLGDRDYRRDLGHWILSHRRQDSYPI